MSRCEHFLLRFRGYLYFLNVLGTLCSFFAQDTDVEGL